MKKKQDSILDLIKGAHDAWSGTNIIFKQSRILWRDYGSFFTWFTLLLRMGLCAFGGLDVWDDGGGDRHWCNLAHRSQVWHLSHCLLPQYGAVLLEQQ